MTQKTATLMFRFLELNKKSAGRLKVVGCGDGIFEEMLSKAQSLSWAQIPFMRYTYDYVVGTQMNLSSVRETISSLKESGKMVVMINANSLSSKDERDILKEFVDKDLIEAIVLLHRFSRYEFYEDVSVIVVLNRQKRHANKILLVNASDLFVNYDDYSDLNANHVKNIYNIFKTFKKTGSIESEEDAKICTIITKDEAAQNDYNLLPSCYVY